MDTCVRKSSKVKGGYKLNIFKSYIFGGLIEDENGLLVTSNDLIEVSTMSVVVDLTYKGEFNELSRPAFSHAECMEAKVKLVQEKGGRRPMPRRDHSSCLVSNNRYLLIYGG